MEETMKNATEELEDQSVPTEEVTTTEQDGTEDALKEAVEAQLRKIQRQNLLLGCQVICRTILDKITTAMSQPGKRTMNDYKRLVKELESFCKTGLSRQVNQDGEVEATKSEINEGD